MAAKKPQDHKPKKPTVKKVTGGKVATFPDVPERDPSGKVATVDGKEKPLSVTVLDEALDDFELLDEMRALDEGNATKMPAVLRRMVGDDFATVMNSLRDPKTGRVTITAAREWIDRLLQALNPNS